MATVVFARCFSPDLSAEITKVRYYHKRTGAIRSQDSDVLRVLRALLWGVSPVRTWTHENGDGSHTIAQKYVVDDDDVIVAQCDVCGDVRIVVSYDEIAPLCDACTEKRNRLWGGCVDHTPRT